MSGQPNVSYPFETNSMMLLGPMPSRIPQQMQQQYQPRKATLAPPEVKCYECGGNHYARECPNRKTQPLRQRLPPIKRYRAGCCVDHFPKDCPTKPSEVSNQGPKTSLNYIGVVPSPRNSESKTERASLNVVTRAQTRKNAQEQSEPKQKNSKGTKRRQKRQTRSKGSKK